MKTIAKAIAHGRRVRVLNLTVDINFIGLIVYFNISLATILLMGRYSPPLSEDLYRQPYEIGYFSDGKGGVVYPACWGEDDDMLVRAPGLEPGTP